MAFITLAYDNIFGTHCQTFPIFSIFFFAEHRNSNLFVPYKEDIFDRIKCCSPHVGKVLCFQYRMEKRRTCVLELESILRGFSCSRTAGP